MLDKSIKIKNKYSLYMLITFCIAASLCCTSRTGEQHTIIFATFAEQEAQLNNILLMAKSIRTFAGQHRNAPIWLYIPTSLGEEKFRIWEQLANFNVNIKTSETPQDAIWYYFARKVFAAAQAEAEADGRTEILAWLDEDTIVLQEPSEFILAKGKALGYRPVMHKNIGLLYTGPVDLFWSRAYNIMSVSESSLFPMVTPADGDTIRPYFNAGCMIVRPKQFTLRKWAEYFTLLYQDSVLSEMCKQDVYKRIFIHQAALTGAIVNYLARDEITQLSDRINYPIFFKQMFGSKREFNNISDVITFRHESYFRNPAPDWYEKLRGPADKITWLKEQLDNRN